MQNVKQFTQRYINWVIKLGRLKFSLLGFLVLAILALVIQGLTSLIIVGHIYWYDVIRSIIFGLLSAPFVIYFFTLLVEKLERARLELAATNIELNKNIAERKRYLEVIEKNSRDKTNLMATISHELRTPLNGIVGLSQILLDSNLTQQQRNYLKTIYVSAVSLGHIFSDIIDLEKLDTKRIEIYLKETDLASFLNDINNMASFMAERKKLKFELQTADNLPNWLMLDVTRLSQILWNLISNAVKFTPQGKITLNVSSPNPEQLQFSLTDTGIGIEQKELSKIFAMYYQVESKQHKQKALGSGIGLAISKRIAKLMGGDLCVQSAVGKGSTFTLTIKVQPLTQPLEQIQAQVTIPLNILLVEDIDVNIIVAKAMLEKLGYSVDVAMTGKQAIEKFETNSYDLLLLDIQLPDMSGFDIAQHLRTNYQNDHYDYLPPLIALTANVINNKQQYLEQGMDDVLCKPLSIEALNRCLCNYFTPEEISTTVSSSVSSPTQTETALLTEELQTIDQPMLQDLLSMLGSDFLQQNIQLFEQMMQQYVEELTQTYQLYQNDPQQQQNLVAIAHKIKGAAASIGLQRIQQLAQQAQQDQDPQWQQQIAIWVNEIARYWQADVVELRQYITNHQSR